MKTFSHVLLALLGMTSASISRADDQWLGLTWKSTTKSEFELATAVIGWKTEGLAEFMKDKILSTTPDYRYITEVEMPKDSGLLCVTFSDRTGNYKTNFVLKYAIKDFKISNFCRN